MQFTDLETINTEACAKHFEDIPELRGAVQKQSLCTMGKKHNGICHGDSGIKRNISIIKMSSKINFVDDLGGALVDVTDPNHKTIVGISSWVYVVSGIKK